MSIASGANRLAVGVKPFAAAGVAFAGMTLVGAFLLFQVQPLVSKAILPWFGGAPAVWTTCMLFFQVLLFAGYASAHLVQRHLGLRGQAGFELLLVAVALALLPILPGEGWKPADSTLPTWHILVLLTASVGLPYFVLSMTSPLVQVWFSRTYPGRSPYRLYALSNFGSLAALLTYPFLFEPAFDLPLQSRFWSLGFVLYAALAALCAAVVWRGAQSAVGSTGEECEVSEDLPGARPSWGICALWLVLPAGASLMLLATTNHVCQDVAVVPFLWVLPLALYLVSFIICFDHPRWYVRGFWAGLTAILIPVAAFADQLAPWFGYDLGFTSQVSLFCGAMFSMAMVCHGELVRLRPSPHWLTVFYLMISAGGALGGVLVSLIAPLVFKSYVEWPIGLVGGYLLSLVVLMLARQAPAGRPGYNIAAVLVPPLVVIAVLAWQAGQVGPVESYRNFYGTVAVWENSSEDPAEHQFLLKHGRIIHGHQYAQPPRSQRGTMYYQEHSGVARAIAEAGRRGPVRVGVVGLGIGTLAVYAREGDEYRFYEINPAVVHLAETYFSYLADAKTRGATCSVVLGDGRLSLEREAPERFDVLVLDAFSGDSIPTHLITREAFEIYQRHLTPTGILAVHITNRALDLAPVVRGLAEHFHFSVSRIYIEGADTGVFCRSDWMLLGRQGDLAKRLVPSPPPDSDEDRRVPLWTDRYSNLFQILKRGG